jgi:hypothetical protein
MNLMNGSMKEHGSMAVWQEKGKRKNFEKKYWR